MRATRVATRGGVIDQADAKTRSSARELDLPPHLIPILRRARREQLQARLAVGSKWEGESDPFVVAHPLGRGGHRAP